MIMPGELPEWFTKPNPPSCYQLSLFPEPLASVLDRMAVSPSEIDRWHAAGWVSFGSSAVSDLQEEQVSEIQIVKDVVRSGLTGAQVEMLLGSLPRPFKYNPRQLAYSFLFGWVEAVPPPDPHTVIQHNIDSWLEHLAETGQVHKLARLAARAAQLCAENLPEESE